MNLRTCASILVIFLMGTHSFAQTIKRCANDEMLERMLSARPELAEKMREDRLHYLQAVADRNGTVKKTTGQVTIPVVFHIVLTQQQLSSIGGAAGVALRVDSQMAVLNRDFNGQSLDKSSIPAIFQPLYANVQIQFGLAHTAPDGSSTPGYEIVVTNNTSFSAQNGTIGSTDATSDAKYTQTGGAASWDADKYLNIWVVNFTETGLLGISPPMSWVKNGGFPKNEVGPTINYRAFGKFGPGQSLFLSGYNGGRTLVHELGHFFEIFHIWGNTSVGSGNCSDDDGINDTPQQDDANSGCPSFPKANCTNATGGEMFMNFMDYVQDGCYRMFTLQQAGIMNFSASDPSGYTYSLSQNTHLLQWPTNVRNVVNENAFQIYPNPSQGVFHLDIVERSELEKIVVTNTLGRTIKNINVTDRQVRNYDIDLTHVSKGIYQVQCIFAQGTLTKKIVIQ